MQANCISWASTSVIVCCQAPLQQGHSNWTYSPVFSDLAISQQYGIASRPYLKLFVCHNNRLIVHGAQTQDIRVSCMLSGGQTALTQCPAHIFHAPQRAGRWTAKQCLVLDKWSSVWLSPWTIHEKERQSMRM